MGKINLLSEEVANLIAAGEVVDRPASVLKELLENAIDAGATAITAEVGRGGVGLLRVSDNGCGIASEDLPVALQRHATSKIKNAEDLDEILTLGFRGEALAAIAGVSVMEIVTRTGEAECGTLLVSEYGKITEVSEVGCRVGTTVLVKELFGNVPARRKFLKKDVTEAQAATAYAEKVALSHPEVALTLIVDGTTRFSTPGDGDVLGVLHAVEGREFAKKMLPVKGEMSGMTLTGYVGRSDNVAGTRNRQSFFINGRYVRSKTMQAALEQAFTSYIAPGKFPSAALFLTLAPGAVDVNVHPAKIEIRFSDERPVFEIVYHAVRGALTEAAYRPERTPPAAPTLRQNTVPKSEPIRIELPPRTPAPSPSVTPSAPAAPAPAARELSPRDSLRILADCAERERAAAPSVASAPVFTYGGAPAPEREVPTPAPAPPPTPEAPAEAPAAVATPFTVIGEAFSTYVLVERGEELLVIDKHAAHERLLFEDLLAEQRAGGKSASQGLLLPLSLHLTATERGAAEEYREDLLSVGFSYEMTQSGATVDAIPAAVEPEAAAALFTEMLASLSEGTGNPATAEGSRRERALWQVACKAAIKGGRHYDEAHVRWLCERVLSRPDITVCPHGRPIAFTMTKHRLDREFNRIQH
ncbi:MAG: DNA mismatch repair endonuclease MutL [Clostridia bacterium]|nr:DNA mismatch repair endonuclease MutL [Clostridia bacterium]